MRTLRRLFAAVVFTLMFTLSTFAGEMSTTVAPPSAPAQDEMTTGLNGDISTGAPGDIHTTEEAADVTLAGAVVDLVQGVLSLL